MEQAAGLTSVACMRYLRPTAPIASDAVLPADPGDALAIAQDLLQAPVMSNHHHGLWGYHGEAAPGRPLTVQSTGIGGPSAAAVLAQLVELGVRRAVRIGACTPLGDRLRPGEAVLVDRALPGDGTSAALGADGAVEPDPELIRALIDAAGDRARPATIASRDLLDGPAPADGAVAVDLETAAVLTLGRAVGVSVAAVLFAPPADPADELSQPALDSARIAAAALD